MAVDPAWVLSLMLKAEANPERSPFRPTYEASARAIAVAASANPLFGGPRGAEETAAEMVSVAWFESHFQVNAEGDHECLTRAPDGKRCLVLDLTKPRSFCAMQVHDSNFKALGVTREELLSDVEKCYATGLRMMKISYGVCAGRPHEERLNQYATGGGFCVRPLHDEGAHRVRKGTWLFRNVPPPPP